MPFYKYIGPDDEAPAKTNFMGKVKFKLNKSSEVTDPQVLAKLQGHPSFKLVKDKKKKVKVVKAPEAEPKAVETPKEEPAPQAAPEPPPEPPKAVKKAPAKKIGRPKKVKPVGNEDAGKK